MSCREGSRPTMRRVTGDALGYAGEVVEIVLVCSACDWKHSEVLAADESIRSARAGLTCLNCARVGTLRMWKPGAEKASA